MLRNVRRSKAVIIPATCILLLFFMAALGGNRLAPYPADHVDLPSRLQVPSKQHWFGTDHLGRDIFSRVIVGSRITLLIAFSAVTVASIAGTVMGMAAGYFGGWYDVILMRVTDILLTFPGVLLALSVVAILGVGVDKLIIALSVRTLPDFVRVVRGTAVVESTKDYIEAARAIGCNPLRTLIRHVAPNVMSTAVVYASIKFSTVILSGAALSFLGLGVQPPIPEWGLMVAQGRVYLETAPHIVLFPGLSIMLVAFAFNLLGDSIRDMVDPRAG